MVAIVVEADATANTGKPNIYNITNAPTKASHPSFVFNIKIILNQDDAIE